MQNILNPGGPAARTLASTGWFVLVPVGEWTKPLAWTFMIAAVVVALLTGADYVARAIRLRRVPIRH